MPAPPFLSDAQIDQLDDLLERRAIPYRGMSLEGLDGFLSALAVGPQAVPETEWLSLVWGPTPPNWESEQERAEVEALLLGHANGVTRRVRGDPDTLPDYLMPLIGLPEDPLADHPDDLDVGVDWAMGFFRAVSLRPEAWDAWLEKEDWIDEIFGLIEQLGSGELPHEPEEAPTPVSYRERLEIIAGLPGMLADLQHYRIEQLTPREPVRRAATPDRNDPCPCGSGRKYKKCCGLN